MFLQRNVANQKFVVPGSLRAISDGSGVASGASITVVKDGTSASGAGTLTHIAEGAYLYTPTQGETDCKILGYILAATGAVALAGSVRTTNGNPDDGTRLGLASLPNAAAGAANGLPTAGTGTNQIDLASGRVNLGKVLDVAVALASGTAQAGASGTITLASGDAGGTNAYVDRKVTIVAGTGVGQSRYITAYNSTTKVATVHRAWDTAPDGTSQYEIGDTAAGTATASLGGNAPAGWINAAAFAADAIDANALKADAVAEIQSGLSTLTQANVRTAVGLASANLDSQIGTLATAAALATVAGYADTEVAAILAAVDTEVAAIKAKTDNLPASPAAVGSAMTLTSAYDAAKTAAQAGNAMTLTAAGADAITIETGLNLRQALAIILAELVGQRSNVTTNNPTIKNPAGTATRVQPTVDSDGNCTAVTLSPPA